MQLVSRDRPHPLLPLLRSAEQECEAEGQHGGNENLQAMPMCDHIPRRLQQSQRVAYFRKTTRHDDSVCPAHV